MHTSTQQGSSTELKDDTAQAQNDNLSAQTNSLVQALTLPGNHVEELKLNQHQNTSVLGTELVSNSEVISIDKQTQTDQVVDLAEAPQRSLSRRRRRMRGD